MARRETNSAKPKKKSTLIAKIKNLVPGKKATTRRAIKNVVKAKPKASVNPDTLTDLAHSPGHRKMNLRKTKGGTSKVSAQDESAVNHMARDDRIFRNQIQQRRVIPGAAIGKHGQRG